MTDIIDKSISSNQKNIINLTSPDMDASPKILEFTMNTNLKKTITIEKRSIETDGFILGSITNGILGTSKLGSPFGSYSTVSTDIVCNYNNIGKSTMITDSENAFGYLACGTGDVTDNATSLVTEILRLDSPDILEGNNYFELVFQMDETTGNGNLFKEYGLAVDNTGDISSTGNGYPIDKNSLLYISINARVYFTNLGSVIPTTINRLNDSGITSIVDLIYDDWNYIRLGDTSTTYDETTGTTGSELGVILNSSTTKDSTSFTRIFNINTLLYNTENISKIFDATVSSGHSVDSYEPITEITNKLASDEYKITVKTELLR